MINISWKKENYTAERGEFERLLKTYSGGADKQALQENEKHLQQFYRNAQLVPLTDSMWSRLENTDSWNTDTIAKIQNAIKANASDSGLRSIENVLREIISGSARAPVVISMDNGKKLELVAGNTRLMVCRMLKIKPMVVMIQSDW